MVKLHLDPEYLEARRQQLVADIRRLARVIGAPMPMRRRLEKIRRRQRALNFINKRLARLERATTPPERKSHDDSNP